MTKQTLEIRFNECEHSGDLDNYAADLVRSGARILSAEINYEAESCVVRVSVANFSRFLAQFRQTEGYLFSSLHEVA